jgi:uncharacterized alkaline shock family protein YloU
MTDDIKLEELIEKDIMSFDAVSRFPGIGFTGNIQKAMLGKDFGNPAIKVTEDGNVLTINCEIIVYFGVNIPQLCYDIQTKVKHDIEEKTGMMVKAVNIRIEGIDKAKDQ